MGLGDFIKSAIEKAEDVISKVKEGDISSILDDIKEGAEEFGAKTAGFFETVSGKVSEQIDSNPKAKAIVDGARDKFSGVMKKITDMIEGEEDKTEVPKEEQSQPNNVDVEEDSSVVIKIITSEENRQNYEEKYNIKSREGLTDFQYETIMDFIDLQHEDELNLTDDQFEQIFSKLMKIDNNQYIIKKLALISFYDKDPELFGSYSATQQNDYIELNEEQTFMNIMQIVDYTDEQTTVKMLDYFKRGMKSDTKELSLFQEEFLNYMVKNLFIDDVYNDFIYSIIEDGCNPDSNEQKIITTFMKAIDPKNGEKSSRLAYSLYLNENFVEYVENYQGLVENISSLTFCNGREIDEDTLSIACDVLENLNFFEIYEELEDTVSAYAAMESLTKYIIESLNLCGYGKRNKITNSEMDYINGLFNNFLTEKLGILKNVKPVKINVNIFDEPYEIKSYVVKGKSLNEKIGHYIFFDEKNESSVASSFVVNKANNSILIYGGSEEFETKMDAAINSQGKSVINSSEEIINNYNLKTNPQAWLIVKFENKYCKIPATEKQNIVDNHLFVELPDSTILEIDLSDTTIIGMDPTSEIMNDIKSQINGTLKRTVHIF